MKNPLVSAFLILAFAVTAFGGGVAEERSKRMGPGMNLSFLENFWVGTKEKHYSDFVRQEEFEAAKGRLAEIRKAGFRTVRLPVNFSAWASMKAPYKWESEKLPEIADKVIGWALDEGLIVLIDLHHPELNANYPEAASTPRMVALWKMIAARYRHLDPERVMFELRNEPHDMPEAEWLSQAKELIPAVRKIAPKHTFVVGFHDWNSRDAMIASKPFDDDNIIYTFHYYHPFVFTHQATTWAGPGLGDLKAVPFPGDPSRPLAVPDSAKGTWVASQMSVYGKEANAEFIDSQLKEARAWADRYKVPIFLGEFGSYGKEALPADRCRHAQAVYSALGKYKIPSAMWEWFSGFNMLDGEKPSQCLQEAIDRYSAALGFAR
jgi:endoglucanase